MKYTKPPLSLESQILLLRERGLQIIDEERALKYLNNVGYYRLTGYMYHLQTNDGTHRFAEGVTFDRIIQHYQFDKKLRAIILEYLERIEVSLRSKLTNNFSLTYGFFWYTSYELFEDKSIYTSINNEVKDRFEDPQERFLKAFKFKYTSESLPPSNMAMEILSLGKLSRLYKALKNGEEKRKIASEYNLPSTILSSWFIYLTNVRNICAHHSRLWNRKITADRFIVPSRKNYKFQTELPNDFNTTVYGIISIIERLIRGINPNNAFIAKIESLVKDYPDINLQSMGFPEDWKTNSAWQ